MLGSLSVFQLIEKAPKIAGSDPCGTVRSRYDFAGFAGFAAAKCDLADSTSDVKPAASFTAMSARIFRSRSMPPTFSP